MGDQMAGQPYSRACGLLNGEEEKRREY